MRLRQLRDVAAAGAPDRMITLTTSRDRYETPDEAAQALVRAWRNVVQRAIREGVIHSIAYLAVFEGHKDGWPHLHILARCGYIPQDWLSDRMAEYTGGFRADIRRLWNRRGASRYIAKYVSKGPAHYEGCKRYWKSQNYLVGPTGWEKEQPIADRPAYVHKRALESIVWAYRRAGWATVRHSDRFYQALRTEENAHQPWLDAYAYSSRWRL